MSDWKETTRQERNRRIFREEIDDFLPRRILDFHVHVFPQGTIPRGKKYNCAGYPMTRYELPELKKDLAALYPGRETLAVCFGMPFPEYNRRANDRYIAQACDRKRFFPFRLFDPLRDTPAAFRRDLVESGFLGIKPYIGYVRKADPNQVEITEMLPDWAMKIVDELGLIVMLHIPRRERLADPLNLRQIRTLCRLYPRAKIVLAHVGRAYYVKNVVGHLDRLTDLDNLWFDTAMLNHWEVLEYLFRKARPDRVLYATDIPIALAPGKSVEINNQYTYLTSAPWHLSVCDTEGKVTFTSFLYEELRAIRTACEKAGVSRRYVRGFFSDNGMALLKSVGCCR